MSNYKKFFDFEEVIKQMRAYLKDLNEKRVRKAFDFAEEAHRGQMRKDEVTPYIAHPVETVKILMQLHADEDTLISGLIHDVPEDTRKTIEDIETLFGKKVAFMVEGITKLSKVHYEQNMPEREVDSLRKLFLHSAQDLRVLIVKLADRLHNMRTLDNITNAEKRLRIATETLEVYVPVADLLGIRDIKSQLEDLCFKYMFPTEYATLSGLMTKSLNRRKAIYDSFVKEIQTAAKSEGIEVKIMKRSRNLYSVYKYLSAEGKGFEDVDERIGVRIIVESVSDCYRLLGTIHLLFAPLIRKFKDYIANPKSNGYQSLHTTVFGVEGNLAEVQIRTDEMHIEAEYGIASHFFFNHGEDFENIFINDPKKSLWLKRVLDFENHDGPNGDFLEELKEDVLKERIIVVSERGAPIDLPVGATVIDFAYAYDREAAERMVRAEVDGRICPLTTVLNTRDVVKIITGEEKTVDISWLSFVATSLAKREIMSYLKRTEPNSKLSRGLKILQREMDILNLGLVEHTNFKRLQKSLEKNLNLNFKSMDQILTALGEGEINVQEITRCMDSSLKNRQNGLIKLCLKILARNRFGLSRDIYDVLYRNISDMRLFKGWYSENTNRAYFITEVSVESFSAVGKLFQEIEQIESVSAVYRTSNRKHFAFVAMAFVVAAVWIGHPLVFSYLAGTNFYQEHISLINFVLYIGLLVMFSLVLFTSNLVEKFFPEMRGRNLVSNIVFILPVLMVAVLGLQILYLGVRIDWAIIGLEILFIYLYLGWNYARYRKFKFKRKT